MEVAPRESPGDTFLAAMQNLQAENAITIGTLHRMYNKVSQKSPQPIFQCIHNNWQIPLVFKNFECKACSVLGISTIQRSIATTNDPLQEQENDEAIGNKYVWPPLMEKFDRRLENTVKHTKTIKSEDFQKEMSLKEFCDRYQVKWTKGEEEHSYDLDLSNRRYRIGTSHYPIRMKPYLGETRANPKSPKFWLYCKHLCLWLIPCHKMEDLMPKEPNMSEEEIMQYWTNKYYAELVDTSKLPRWAKGMHKLYHGVDDDDSDCDNVEDAAHVRVGMDDNDDEQNSSDASIEDEMDDDPRAKRTANPFYQNPEDQAHFRDVDTVEDIIEQYPSIIEMSNPKGENFMKWAEGQRLPSYEEIIQQLTFLKQKAATADKVPQVPMNNKQTLFHDIVQT